LGLVFSKGLSRSSATMKAMFASYWRNVRFPPIADIGLTALAASKVTAKIPIGPIKRRRRCRGGLQAEIREAAQPMKAAASEKCESPFDRNDCGQASSIALEGKGRVNAPNRSLVILEGQRPLCSSPRRPEDEALDIIVR
jgi:hypothetical protein